LRLIGGAFQSRQQGRATGARLARWVDSREFGTRSYYHEPPARVSNFWHAKTPLNSREKRLTNLLLLIYPSFAASGASRTIAAATRRGRPMTE
jgi:hypothetical protein